VKKLRTIQLINILLGASLLAACGQTANVIPIAPTDNAVVSAPTAALLAATNSSTKVPAPTIAPRATSTPKSTDANSIPLTVDPCNLLTKEDISKVLGEAVESVTQKDGPTYCDYKTRNFALTMKLAQSGGTINMHAIPSFMHALDVPGLGDEAFYIADLTTLLVRKGDSLYYISLDRSDLLSLDDIRAKEKALAELLLSHLS
jgi:hypothetical protein